MSGSPVIYNDSIIGVLVGGPALFGQRHLFNAAKELWLNNVRASWDHFIKFMDFRNLYEKNMKINILLKFYSILFRIIGLELPPELAPLTGKYDYEDIKGSIVARIISQISELAFKLKDKDQLTHNSALPYNRPAFQELLLDAEAIFEDFLSVNQVESFDRFYRS